MTAPINVPQTPPLAPLTLEDCVSPSFGTALRGVTNSDGIEVLSLMVDRSIPVSDDDFSFTVISGFGIGVTALNASLGTWQYSLNGGVSWLTIRTELVNSLTNELALLLDPVARIRLVPFGDLTGDLNDALTFRAWDMSRLGDPGSYVPVEATGGGSAFSAASYKDSIAVTNTNPTTPAYAPTKGYAILPASLGASAAGFAYAQADGDIIVVGENSNKAPIIVRLNGDGSVDKAFGTNGLSAVGSGDWFAAAIQLDGKVVTASAVSNGLKVTRWKADGSIDTSFGAQGTASLGAGTNAPNSILVQADGKLIIAATGSLIRLNTNGSLDTSFSSGGIGFGVQSQALQADGKIIVAGKNGGNFLLGRLHQNGSLDTSFGLAGKATVLVDSGPLSAFFSGANNVFVLPDGKLLVSGYGRTGDSLVAVAFVVRLNADGSPDSSFGDAGTARLVLGNFSIKPTVQAVQPDGKVILAGTAPVVGEGPKDTGGAEDFALIRLTADGQLDTSFGEAGVVRISTLNPEIGLVTNTPYSVSLQPDGKILVAGARISANVNFVPQSSFSVVRLNTDGSLDTSFGQARSADGTGIVDVNTAIPQLSVSVVEDAVNPTGITVAALITDGAIVTSNQAHPPEAIVIVGLDVSLGTWQFSVNSGTTWQSIRADWLNSDTNSLGLALGPTAMLRLVPAHDLSGTVPHAIVFRA